MNLNARIQASDFELQMARLRQLSGKSLVDLMRDETRLYAQALANKTQPTGTSSSVGRSFMERIKDATENRFQSVSDTIFNQRAKAGLTQGKTLLADTYEQTKRLNKAMRKGFRADVIARESNVQKLVKEKQANAGIAKAGWIMAGKQVDQKTKAPAWIMRHVKQSKSAGDGDIAQDAKGVTSTLENLTSYASATIQKNTIKEAEAARARSIKSKCDRYIRAVAQGRQFKI